MPLQCPICIKGAGEMASGIAVRLFQAGFQRLLLLESPEPTSVRRTVSFSEAVYDGQQEVEGVTALRLEAGAAPEDIWTRGGIAVAVDPQWQWVARLRPEVVVDAVLAKRNLGTALSEAPLVVGVGPGFTAGQDVHAVVESLRGHYLGRVYWQGAAAPNTGVPGDVGGHTLARVLRAPCAGLVRQVKEIGQDVRVGETVCTVNNVAVPSALDGIVRGCIRPGITVPEGMKLGDVDARCEYDHCFTVSEKARALGGAVLEVLCAHCLRGGLANPVYKS